MTVVMSETNSATAEIRQVFHRHIPEIAAGAVEIVSVARDVGRRSYVAVRAHVPGVDPVGACTGERGARLKAMVADLGLEHLTLVRWENSTERFIRNALAGLNLSTVALNSTTREASVTVESAKMVPEQIEPGHPEDSDLLLASELTGWKISLHGQQGP